MYPEREHQLQSQHLQEMSDGLSPFDPKSMANTDRLGTALDFSKTVPLFEDWARLFKDIDSIDSADIPISMIAVLIGILKSAKENLMSIGKFNPSDHPDPSRVRDNYISNLKSLYDEKLLVVMPIISYSRMKGVAFDDIKKRSKDILNDMVALRQEMEKMKDDAQSALAQIQKATSQSGVAQHAYHFEEEAKKHVSSKKKWLWATISLAIVICAFGVGTIGFYMKFTDEMSLTQLIQLTISKFMIFGALFYALVWSGRTYRAESHNAVVNKHRQNALKTFEAFVKASSDEQTRSAVLLQATQSIFSHQSSGFAQGDKDDSPAKVMEIVRSVMPGTGSQ